MFVIELVYEKEVEEIDKHLAVHIKFLEENHEKGIFIASGPKVPRTGGIILADLDSRENLEKLMKEDPFVKNEVCSCIITEFSAMYTSKK